MILEKEKTRFKKIWCPLLQVMSRFDSIPHTCEPVASKNLEKFSGELAKKLKNFVGLRYIKNVGK